jgi:RNA polymerase sigma-70 factor (ECF subfamily)
VSDELRRELAGLIPRLRRFARVLTGNMSDADDVAQATLEKAMRNLGQWQQGTRLDRWVFAIARNTWIDDRRLAHNRTHFDDISMMTELSGEDGLAVVESRSTQKAVQDAVARLPDDQRTLIALVILEGYSYREAAEMLDIPIGTVMSRLARGKSALAQQLGEERAAL